MPPEKELREIERVAVELANLSGAEIVTALGDVLEVKYKDDPATERAWRDPVSEVDHRCERLIRDRLAERFPEHDIIGEEFDARPGRDHDFVWTVDPIDGTANFVNGFPMFAAAIGVLYRGWPVVGALWCSTSHALRSGTYHATRNGSLEFDGRVVEPRHNPAVKRRLAGVPHTYAGETWETRKTGSAAIECAFVAAGLLQAARFDRPNLWDVAGGVALVQASGGAVLAASESQWIPFSRFEVSASGSEQPDLRSWKRPLIVGRASAEVLKSGLGER